MLLPFATAAADPGPAACRPHGVVSHCSPLTISRHLAAPGREHRSQAVGCQWVTPGDFSSAIGYYRDAMDYTYDVFISPCNSQNKSEWLIEYILPLCDEYLTNEIIAQSARPPRKILFDGRSYSERSNLDGRRCLLPT